MLANGVLLDDELVLLWACLIASVVRFPASGSLRSRPRLHKVGFHWRRSRSRSRNQKLRAIRSGENQADGVRSRTLIPLMTTSLMIS